MMTEQEFYEAKGDREYLFVKYLLENSVGKEKVHYFAYDDYEKYCKDMSEEEN